MFDAFRRAYLYFFNKGGQLVTVATKRQLECDDEEEVISPKYRKIGSPGFHHTPLTSLDFLIPPEVRMKKGNRTLQNELSLIRGRAAEMSSRKASKENISVQNEECIIVSDEEDDWVPATPIPKAISRLNLKQKSVQSISSDTNHSSVDKVKKNEIEVLKTVKSKDDCPLHFSTPREGLSIINKRFFPSVRREPSVQFGHKHSAKMKEPHEHSSKPKKRSALDESIRLDEKMQYSQLLKQQCSTAPFFFGSRLESSPKKTNNKMENEDLSKNKSVVDIIDLTEDATEPEKENTDTQIDVNQIGNPELEIIDEKTPKQMYKDFGKLFNPFKNDLYCTDWLAAETEIFDFIDKERERRIEEQKIKAKLYNKQNKKLSTHILEERIRNHMKITEAILDDEVVIEEEEEAAVLPKLTPEIERRVASALRPEPQSEVLVEAFSLKITRHDICTLAGTNWLNDEVINFYMNLLIERGKKNKYPPVYAFNTFFYPRLQSSGFSAVKRWTRKVDLFANEIIIIPVHLGVHWCMAAINFKNKTICYYDSMGGNNDICLQLLWKYLGSEKMDKKQQQFDYDGWKTENVKRIPQQMNGSDCGVFSCTYAEFICRNSAFRFSQKDMPYFRRKMVYEILSKELMM